MNVYLQVIFMTVQLGKYLFHKPAAFKTSIIRITTKYRPVYKIFGDSA